jgi:6-pyruvoyl-tetrahydropterin synthase
VSTEEFPRDDIDMSLDFGDLKNILRKFDHKMIVTAGDPTFTDPAIFEPEGVVVIKGKGPSVENVAIHAFDEVVAHIQAEVPRAAEDLHGRSDHHRDREQHLLGAPGCDGVARASPGAAPTSNFQFPTPKEFPTPNSQRCRLVGGCARAFQPTLAGGATDRAGDRASPLGSWEWGLPWKLVRGDWELTPTLRRTRGSAFRA